MLRPETRERRPKWYLLYYALAAIVTLTICGSLYLNHSVREIYQESVAVNQEWAEPVQTAKPFSLSKRMVWEA